MYLTTAICLKNINNANGAFKEYQFLAREIMELNGQNSEVPTTNTVKNMNLDLNHK